MLSQSTRRKFLAVAGMGSACAATQVGATVPASAPTPHRRRVVLRYRDGDKHIAVNADDVTMVYHAALLQSPASSRVSRTWPGIFEMVKGATYRHAEAASESEAWTLRLLGPEPDTFLPPPRNYSATPQQPLVAILDMRMGDGSQKCLVATIQTIKWCYRLSVEIDERDRWIGNLPHPEALTLDIRAIATATPEDIRRFA